MKLGLLACGAPGAATRTLALGADRYPVLSPLRRGRRRNRKWRYRNLSQDLGRPRYGRHRYRRPNRRRQIAGAADGRHGRRRTLCHLKSRRVSSPQWTYVLCSPQKPLVGTAGGSTGHSTVVISLCSPPATTELVEARLRSLALGVHVMGSAPFGVASTRARLLVRFPSF